jgi:hypothetical protein
MKKTIVLTVATVLFAALNVQAQVPADFAKGSITLADGSSISGYVKDNMKKDASIIYLDNNGTGKKKFDGSQINAVNIDAANYQCIKGDFFKNISTGKISFLQKASNAGGKTIYNGAEAIILSGTEGKIGDYFSYTDNELSIINKKTTAAFISQLGNCTAAVEKAKSANGDMAAMAEAVTIYNNQNK